MNEKNKVLGEGCIPERAGQEKQGLEWLEMGGELRPSRAEYKRVLGGKITLGV